LSGLGHEQAAGRILRPYRPYPQSHRRCARLRQCAGRTVQALLRAAAHHRLCQRFPLKVANMKFTLDWLKDHLDTQASADEIGTALTVTGLEVESIDSQGKALDGFVVAHVVEAKRHPNSDHLSVCKVDAGTGERIDVVCGAPNCRTGMKSVFAFPGTYIPGKDFELKAGVVIRGAPSNGMLCSGAELELSNDHDGILELPAEAPVGTKYVDYAGLDGVVFDISITPNR